MNFRGALGAVASKILLAAQNEPLPNLQRNVSPKVLPVISITLLLRTAKSGD